MKIPLREIGVQARDEFPDVTVDPQSSVNGGKAFSFRVCCPKRLAASHDDAIHRLGMFDGHQVLEEDADAHTDMISSNEAGFEQGRYNLA